MVKAQVHVVFKTHQAEQITNLIPTSELNLGELAFLAHANVDGHRPVFPLLRRWQHLAAIPPWRLHNLQELFN
jgi:hypothetical protein